MGLRQATNIAGPAFLGSVVDTNVLVASILGRPSVRIPTVDEANALVLSGTSAGDLDIVKASLNGFFLAVRVWGT